MDLLTTYYMSVLSAGSRSAIDYRSSHNYVTVSRSDLKNGNLSGESLDSFRKIFKFKEPANKEPASKEPVNKESDNKEPKNEVKANYGPVGSDDIQDAIGKNGQDGPIGKESPKEIAGDNASAYGMKKDAIIALYTISTRYLNGGRSSNIKDLTTVLFLPVEIDYSGRLYKPEGRYPWIPQEYLFPLAEAGICINEIGDYDAYLKRSTGNYYQCKDFADYLSYADKMFDNVAITNIGHTHIVLNRMIYELDENCYLFEDTSANVTFNIMNMYAHLLDTVAYPPNGLYKIFAGMEGKVKPLAESTEGNESEGGLFRFYAGHMNGKHCLSPSQRKAVKYLCGLGEGRVLAVSGPPGTGKTTLLQTVVANLFVEHALKADATPPIIVAASTNNKAVTNIIDSFGSIEKSLDERLEQRWICTAFSFATYFPSKTRFKELEKEGREKASYQYAASDGGGFIEDLEKRENVDCSRTKFLEQCSSYFGVELKCIDEAVAILYKNLRMVDAMREGVFIDLDLHASKEKELSDKHISRKGFEESLKSIESRKKEWIDQYGKMPEFFKNMRSNKATDILWYLLKLFFSHEDEKKDISVSTGIEDILSAYDKKIKDKIDDFRKRNKYIDDLKTQLHEIKKRIINTLTEFRINGKKIFENRDEIIQLILEGDLNSKDNLKKINDILDRMRYLEFWLAVHYYEGKWLASRTLPKGQEGTGLKRELTREELIGRYKSLAMISPCFVMTLYILPKMFAYKNNGKLDYKGMGSFIDLLIIDEAGQVPPEIAAPSFWFAKRALVVGDEQQIPPIWEVSRGLDMALAASSGAIATKGKSLEEIKSEFVKKMKVYNCHKSSVLKIALHNCPIGKEKGVFLIEHRRCYDEIIKYSNELVYEKKLKPLRKSGNTSANPLYGYLPVVGYYDIPSDTSMKAGSSRYNINEVNEIVGWLDENLNIIMELYRKKDKKEDTDTKKEKNNEDNSILGIITPFKAQASRLRTELDKRGFRYVEVGTVHKFQGAEKKIIIFSSVYGSEDGCYFIDANKSLMNVAVSRAKDSFLFFGDARCLSDNSDSASGHLKSFLKEGQKVERKLKAIEDEI